MLNKKEIDVLTLRKHVNNMLKNSTCSKEQRLGMIAVLESVLYETNNYSGFRYLEASEIPELELPGINKFNNLLTFEKRFKNTDDTRRYYF